MIKFKICLCEQDEQKKQDEQGIDLTNIEDFSEKEIGRIYELKKLYARLLAILQYLRMSSDPTLIALGNRVERVVDLFRLLVDNLEKYIDDVDNIIIALYQFVRSVYMFMSEYAKTHEV